MNDPICHSIEEIWNSNFPNWVSVNEPFKNPGDFGYGDSPDEYNTIAPKQWERDRDKDKTYDPIGPINIHPIGGGGVRGLEKIVKLPKICVRAAGGAVPKVPAPLPKLPEVPKTETDPKTDPDNKGDEPSNKDNESPSDEHDADPPPPEFHPGPVTPRPAAE